MMIGDVDVQLGKASRNALTVIPRHVLRQRQKHEQASHKMIPLRVVLEA